MNSSKCTFTNCTFTVNNSEIGAIDLLRQKEELSFETMKKMTDVAQSVFVPVINILQKRAEAKATQPDASKPTARKKASAKKSSAKKPATKATRK